MTERVIYDDQTHGKRLQTKALLFNCGDTLLYLCGSNDFEQDFISGNIMKTNFFVL